MSLFQPALGFPRRSRPSLAAESIGFVAANNGNGPAVNRSGCAVGMFAVVVHRRTNTATPPDAPEKYEDVYSPAGAASTCYIVASKFIEPSDLTGDVFESGAFGGPGGRTMVCVYGGPVGGLAQVVGSTPTTTTARTFTELTGIGAGSWVGGYVRSPSGSLVTPGGFSRAGDTLDQIWDTNGPVVGGEWDPADAAAGSSGVFFDIAWEIETA